MPLVLREGGGSDPAAPMRVLGIDTATAIGSVGLADDARIVVERSGPAVPADGRSGHGGMLAPLVRRALGDAGWRAADLDAIAVSIGPGSFTGLRVGLGFAKGLAYAAQAAIAPVPTLDALAIVADAAPGEFVCPMLDARKGEVYAALYRMGDSGVLDPLTGCLLARPEVVLEGISGRCRFLGDAVDVHAAAIERAHGAAALVLPFSHYHPRGGVVAALGSGLPRLGPEALGAVEPTYVRPAYVQVGHATRRQGPDAPGPTRSGSRGGSSALTTKRAL